MYLSIRGIAMTSVAVAIAAATALGSGVAWAAPAVPERVAPAAVAASCTTNTSASGLYWHVKCSSLLAGKTQYRAIAGCKSGNRAYGKWTTVRESRYIGSVAYCGSGVQPWNSGYEMR